MLQDEHVASAGDVDANAVKAKEAARRLSLMAGVLG
jgi:hypothetical protein